MTKKTSKKVKKLPEGDSVFLELTGRVDVVTKKGDVEVERTEIPGEVVVGCLMKALAAAVADMAAKPTKKRVRRG